MIQHQNTQFSPTELIALELWFFQAFSAHQLSNLIMYSNHDSTQTTFI